MVFGLFSNKEKNLKRTIDRATNKLSQQADRWGALEALKKDGSDEALAGLCKRWSITSQKAIEDEQEKAWVVDVLVANGAGSLGPLVAYMKTAETLSYALRALEKIGDHDKILEIADELFATEQPGYVRMPDRRIDILRWFGEWKGATDDERVSRLTPYVTDFDENSRFAAIDGMASAEPEKIVEPLVTALTRPDEESGRIKRHIVEILAKAKAPLGDKAAAVTAVLTGPLGAYRVDGGVIKQR
jgi:HEAT repeat protein